MEKSREPLLICRIDFKNALGTIFETTRSRVVILHINRSYFVILGRYNLLSLCGHLFRIVDFDQWARGFFFNSKFDSSGSVKPVLGVKDIYYISF